MSSSTSQRVLDYLEQQPGTTFTKLYQQPSTALAIFRRMLPHLAKTLVMALLYTHEPSPAADIDRCFKAGAESQQAKDRAFSIVQRLRILLEETEGGAPCYKLSPAFARSLRQALSGGGKNHRSFGVPSTVVNKNVTVEFLDGVARRQWETILYYVVGSAGKELGGDKQAPISPGAASLLEQGKFVSVRGSHRFITQAGFTFLLQEVNAQIWTLLVVYLELSPHVSRTDACLSDRH